MTKEITNFIKFEADTIKTAKGQGRISTLDRDVEVTFLPFTSENPKAPSHQIFAKSPAGYAVQIGGMWMVKSNDGNDYYTLSIKSMGYNANLGIMAGQDDVQLQAVIPWEPKAS